MLRYVKVAALVKLCAGGKELRKEYQPGVNIHGIVTSRQSVTNLWLRREPTAAPNVKTLASEKPCKDGAPGCRKWPGLGGSFGFSSAGS